MGVFSLCDTFLQILGVHSWFYPSQTPPEIKSIQEPLHDHCFQHVPSKFPEKEFGEARNLDKEKSLEPTAIPRLWKAGIPSLPGGEPFSKHKDSTFQPCVVAVRALMTMGTEPVPWSDELSFLPGFHRSHLGSVNKMTGLDGCLPSRDIRVCLSKMTQANIATGSAATGWGANEPVNWKGIRLSDGRGRTQHSHPLESLP